jgi:aspartyl-tRNA(Asn)/glutamyl-tRNA(Gln) amidotransferase subunit C
MTISEQDLEKIAGLVCLDLDSDASELQREINLIMDLADQLGSIDTRHIQPISHPFALYQSLRPDVITESDCIAELEAIAPLAFEDALYLVPKVLEAS